MILRTFVRPLALLWLGVSSALTAGDIGWPSYGGDPGNSHYSVLDQVNRDNVTQLQVAWTYHSAGGKPIHPTSEVEVNPLVIDGILYGRNPLHNVFAVEATTGRELWVWDPFAEREVLLGAYMRGLAWWSQGDQKRLLVTIANYLVALDPVTGRPAPEFGDKGWLDLKRDLGRDPATISVYAPSPAVVYRDLAIVGTATTEGEGAAPGDIRAYDVHSGKLRWTFHTIPHPGEFGHDTWPADAWQRAGGANAWSGLTLDAEGGVVFVPTGSPTPDFNGQRRHGANLFGNSVIALDAATGKRLWHYQTVHHDLWDRDLSSPPTLVSVQRDGRDIPALAQASKQGFIYLLDRASGEPVFPIEEVPVPPSGIPGERAWPYQPRVTLPEPLTRQAFTRAEITDINPAATANVRAKYDTAQPFAFFRPVGTQPTIVFPAFYGATNYGGGAFDPGNRTYYINAMEAAHLVQMVRVEVPAGEQGTGFGRYVYQKHCSGCHGADRAGFYPYAPSLVGLPERLTREAATATISSGRGRMMPFGGLPRHELQSVVEYLFAADKPAADSGEEANTRVEYMFGGYADFLDDRGYPAIKPPWGTLNAIDLDTGRRKWQITLGEIPALTAEGVPPTGTLNYGGPVVTAGGLLFIAATTDEKIRAFDKDSGKLVWEYQLPAAGYATPATYMVKGKQYIVIACGGGKLGTPAGDQYVAFALP